MPFSYHHTMSAPTYIYLASPLGFSEAGRHYMYQVLVPELEKLGYTILDPWKLTDEQLIASVAGMPYGQDKRDAWAELSTTIGKNNEAAIEKCHYVFAVLDGVDVDSGTASEIGYAAALGKRIVGYRGDFRLSADNEGLTVNLQVEYFIRKNGGNIITELYKLPAIMQEICPLLN